MKTFLIITTIVSFSSALTPQSNFYVPFWNQFHPQNALDQYAYGFNAGLSTKNEVKLFDGTIRGGYTYVDADGELQSIIIGTPQIEKPKIKRAEVPKDVQNRLDLKAFTRHYEDNLHKPISDEPDKDQGRAVQELNHGVQLKDVYAEYIPYIGYQYNPQYYAAYKPWAYSTK